VNAVSTTLQSPPRIARVLVAVWVVVNVGMLIRGLVPAPRPWSASLPWSMFLTPSAIETTTVAEGLDSSGRWVEIPLHRYFGFTRGWTGRRVPDTSKFLARRGHTDERAAFARWLAARMAADGTPVRVVRLQLRWTEDGVQHTRARGRFEVDLAAPR
jgi:hypothetical protein